MHIAFRIGMKRFFHLRIITPLIGYDFLGTMEQLRSNQWTLSCDLQMKSVNKGILLKKNKITRVPCSLTR